MKAKYKTSSHTKYLCQYHIVFCPKFRYKVLNKSISKELNTIIKDICKEYEYDLLECSIQVDHVHLFIGAKHTVSPVDIVRTIKSISAISLFKLYPKLKEFYSRCGSLWSRGSFICTIGIVSEKTIRKYIQEQEYETIEE